MSEFKTIAGSSEGLFKEKGSKFIALAFHVESEKGVEEIIAEVRKKYHDARHHCYAWTLGLEDQTYRVNDDGEPSHSAGDPILGQIRAFGLTNVLVIVVRYFGGIKLGVGGLISAYKSAAKTALEDANIISLFSSRSFWVSFSYDLTGEMERIFNDFNIEFSEKSFGERCEFFGMVKADEADIFFSRLECVYGISYEPVS